MICPTCLARPDRGDRCAVDGSALLAVGSDPLCGRVLAERYLALDVLGRGGMGVVYRAWQRSTHREVALKVVLPERAGTERALVRFEREARATASLVSPHTVTVFDFGRLEGGGLYLVMELVPGEALADVLSREAPLGPVRACTLVEHMCLSLEEAHGRGLVHRDLKPGNVIVVPVGDGVEMAKVLDFGLVKALTEDEGRLTETGGVLGTPLYMSPEQCQGTEVGAASDLYSLGVLLHELVSGTPPFRGDTMFQVMSQHVYSPPPRLADAGVAPATAALLQPVIDRCLAKAAADRYATATELRRALVAVRASLPPDGTRRFRADPAFVGADTLEPGPIAADETLDGGTPAPEAAATEPTVPPPAPLHHRGLWLGAGAAAIVLVVWFAIPPRDSEAPAPVAIIPASDPATHRVPSEAPPLEPAVAKPAGIPAPSVAPVVVEAAPAAAEDARPREGLEAEAPEIAPRIATPEKPVAVPKPAPSAQVRWRLGKVHGGVDAASAKRAFVRTAEVVGCHRKTQRGADAGRDLQLSIMVRPAGTVSAVSVKPKDTASTAFLDCARPSLTAAAFTAFDQASFGTVSAVVGDGTSRP